MKNNISRKGYMNENENIGRMKTARKESETGERRLDNQRLT